MNLLRLVAVTLVALLAGLVWGVEVHRSGIFPYRPLRAAAAALGLAEQTSDREVLTADEADVDRLVALGYVDSSFDPDHRERGVLLLDRERAFPGVRFYTSATAREAWLIDPDGVALHRWEYPTDVSWQFAHLLADGDILVMRNRHGLTRLSSSSDLVWSVDVEAHHDLCVFDGQIYALTQEAIRDPSLHPTRSVLEEFVSRYTMDGQLVDRVSLLDVLRGSPYRFLLPSIDHLSFDDDKNAPDAPLDIVHSNHVEVLDGSAAAVAPYLRRGNILVSSRHLNLVFIFDPKTLGVEWLWGPSNLSRPHHPVLLPSGRILLFNNGRARSEVLELDPLTYRVVWRFAEDGFFSRHRGSVQRLANGNTLITESDAGRVFEVTGEGRTVWRFANPDVDRKGHRGIIFRMTAHARDATPFIASLTGAG